jgi:hypothetical protein
MNQCGVQPLINKFETNYKFISFMYTDPQIMKFLRLIIS